MQYKILINLVLCPCRLSSTTEIGKLIVTSLFTDRAPHPIYILQLNVFLCDINSVLNVEKIDHTRGIYIASADLSGVT